MKIKIHNLPDTITLCPSEIENIIRFVSGKINLHAESCDIILIDDDTLRSMHEHYLSDPEYTDVMTFNLGEEDIEGEIYISIDRIIDNADFYKVSINNEFIRTLIHGLLHLSGQNDKTEAERSKMRLEENRYIELIQSELKFEV